jgi:hypothetical protein
MRVLLSPYGSRIGALRDTVSELLGMDEPRKRFAAMMSGLDIHYVTPWANRADALSTWFRPPAAA